MGREGIRCDPTGRKGVVRLAHPRISRSEARFILGYFRYFPPGSRRISSGQGLSVLHRGKVVRIDP